MRSSPWTEAAEEVLRHGVPTDLDTERLQGAQAGTIVISEHERLLLLCHEVVAHVALAEPYVVCLTDTTRQSSEVLSGLRSVLPKYRLKMVVLSRTEIEIGWSAVRTVAMSAMPSWLENHHSFGLVDFRRFKCGDYAFLSKLPVTPIIAGGSDLYGQTPARRPELAVRL